MKTQRKTPLMIPVGEFGEIIHELVMGYGGYVDYHAHLDRAGMLGASVLQESRMNPLDVARQPLRTKQNVVGEVHNGPGHTKEALKRRIGKHLRIMHATGTRKVTSFIDATPDIGLRAIEAAIEVRKALKRKIDFQIAVHPIFGFKKDEDLDHIITRWDLFERACSLPEVSIVGALPEKDDRLESMGSDEHLRQVLKLGKKLRKPVHVHVGQANDPRERNIFDLIDFVRCIKFPPSGNEHEPMVWAVHNISASAFSEHDRGTMLAGLKKYRIGVVICPRAAISMRQKRAILAPTHNSIAPVLEMLLAGIPVRLGNDNIADMFVPTGSGALLTEVLLLADILRFYDPHVLAKLAAGIPLNQTDLEIVRDYLTEDVKVHRSDDPNFKFCISLDS